MEKKHRDFDLLRISSVFMRARMTALMKCSDVDLLLTQIFEFLQLVTLTLLRHGRQLLNQLQMKTNPT